jgi:hypothetical protein
VGARDPFSGKETPAIRLAQAYVKLGGKLPGIAVAETEIASPAGSGPDKVEGGVIDKGTRFLASTNKGRASQSSLSIQSAASSIAKALGVSAVNVSAIGDDTLSVTTESPVDRKALIEALKKASGDITEITIDRPIPHAN